MGEPISFGRYRLCEQLAAGEVADIYRAETATADGRDQVVVIKRFRDELSSDAAFAGAFIDEAKIAAALDHPNIARVYEWSRQDGALFIAMEYIAGTNLASLLQSCAERGLRLPPELALHVVDQVLAALEYAHGVRDAYGHAMGIVHRGVELRNVLIASDGRVKLVDFGMARAESRLAGTRPDIEAGGRVHAAPEVIQRAAVDARADLYSAGVLLYELLAGVALRAAPGREVDSVAAALQQRPATSLQAGVPPGIDDLLARACAADPARRFAGAGEMRQALQAVAAAAGAPADAGALARFTEAALSGQPAGQAAAGFAFGEATSHWFAQGEGLERIEPAAPAGGEPLPPPAAAPAPAGGGFSGGSTVMAVEQSGLGPGRHRKVLLLGLGGLALLVGLVLLIVWGATEDGPEQPPAAAEPKVERELAGPLHITTRPDNALVRIDGQPVEPAGDPPRILNLAAGSHQLELMAPGYRSWSGPVELAAGEPTHLERALEPRLGSLVLRSRPRALVWLDGKRRGRTPLRIPELSIAATHQVALRARRRPPLRFEIKPSDWPAEPESKLVIEKTIPRRKRRGRRRR